MATCPQGHDSTTADYCDVCGVRLSGGALVPPVAESAPEAAGPAGADTCPRCGTPRTGRFCEADGYDFVTATLNPAGTPAAAPAATPAAAPAAAGPTWVLVAGASRTWYDQVRANGGPDADALVFPAFVPERRFPLAAERVTIGRRSRSRGITPDIDLVGPPEDPGVSHLHAVLLAQPDGTWTVMDLGSANGTYLNDPAGEPLRPNEPAVLAASDTLYLGAWTTLTVTAPEAPSASS